MKRQSDLVLRTGKPDASHVSRLPFPAESDDPAPSKCFVFVCCQDHYVVQCVVRKRSRPWAPLVPTRPPFTTCWPRSSSHHGPCGPYSSHQPQLRAEKALLAHTKHMTKAFFFAKKDFLSVGPALLLGSGVIVHPGQKKRGRGGLEENSATLLSKNSFIPVSRRSPPLRVQEARSASRLPQWHKGELVTTGFHIVVSFVWILEPGGSGGTVSVTKWSLKGGGLEIWSNLSKMKKVF